MSLEDRVGQVEREQVRQGEQLGRLSAELGAVRTSVADVGTDVKKLLEREARRPGVPTLQTVAVTCAALASIAGVVWWLIGTSPAVQELQVRLGRLDDPIVGRVPRIERQVETITGWRATITKGR